METIAEKETATGNPPNGKVPLVPLQLKLKAPLVDRVKRLAFNSRRSAAAVATAAFEAYLPGAEKGVKPR